MNKPISLLQLAFKVDEMRLCGCTLEQIKYTLEDKQYSHIPRSKKERMLRIIHEQQTSQSNQEART